MRRCCAPRYCHPALNWKTAPTCRKPSSARANWRKPATPCCCRRPAPAWTCSKLRAPRAGLCRRRARHRPRRGTGYLMAFQIPFLFSGSSSSTAMDSRARQSKMMEYDQPLVWVTLLLMLFGMVMVYSASISLPDSPKFANYVRWQNTYFLTRQAAFIVISLLAGLFVFRIRIADLQKAAPYLFIGTLVLLVLVLIPGLG